MEEDWWRRDRETLLVVLGAGASYDNVPGRRPGDATDGSVLVGAVGLPSLQLDEVRPPLTQDLARPGRLTNWALERWPLARPVVDYLRRHVVEATTGRQQVVRLESALQEYQAGEDIVPERALHMFAMRFYLQDLLWASTAYSMSASLTGGVSNYLTLVSRLLEWAGRGGRQVVVISFNYDLMVERALKSMWGFSARRMGDYLAHDRVGFLKPHGSIHWGWELQQVPRISSTDPVAFGRRSIEFAVQYGVERSLTVVPRATFEGRTVSGETRQPYVPALAMPLDGKSDFVWPPEQRERFDLCQGLVTRVLTIGWRGMEPHFLDLLPPLVTAGAKVLTVAGNDLEALDTADNLRGSLDDCRREWRTSGDGFSSLMEIGDTPLDWLLTDVD